MNSRAGAFHRPGVIVSLSLWLLVTALVGCKSSNPQTAAKAPPAAPPPAEQPVAAVPVTQTSWAPDALEELLAPIALYPDALVGQILAASVSPQEVLDAGNWILEHPKLQGTALDDSAKALGFGPATQALLHFTDVLDMMCRQMDWTRQLGSAFTSDQKAVLDAIQRLRASAKAVGNLKTTPQQTVETTTEQGTQVIEVKPADPQVVYVPQYDPQVVYTTPPPATSTTTVIHEEDNSSDALVGGLIGFGVGMMVGAAFSNSYCYPHYGYGAVYMGPRPFYPAAYAYRPAYGGGFYASGGYNNRTHIGRTNININNNYFNRFDNNANLKGGGNRNTARSPIGNTKYTGGGRGGSRGQTAYAGAKGGAGSRGGGAAPGTRTAAGAGTYNGGRQGSAARSSGADRGYAGSSRGSSTYNGASRPSSNSDNGSRASQSRGSSPEGATRSSGASPRADNVSRSSSPSASQFDRGAGASGGRESAFSGASERGSGSFDQASSARGRASTSSMSSSRSSSAGRSMGGSAGGRAGGGGGRGRR
jgi:hypothetical protein